MCDRLQLDIAVDDLSFIIDVLKVASQTYRDRAQALMGVSTLGVFTYIDQATKAEAFARAWEVL